MVCDGPPPLPLRLRGMSPMTAGPVGWPNGTGTSAMGSIGRSPPVLLLTVAGALAVHGTSSCLGGVGAEVAWQKQESHTTSCLLGRSGERPEASRRQGPITGSALAELRRRSGLTWPQLATVFGVSPRSLHFWASGKPMSTQHEEHRSRVLALVRAAGRPADAVRAALLSVLGGEQALGVLAARQYAQVVTALGVGGDRAISADSELAPLYARSVEDWQTAARGRRPGFAVLPASGPRPPVGADRLRRTRRARRSGPPGAARCGVLPKEHTEFAGRPRPACGRC